MTASFDLFNPRTAKEIKILRTALEADFKLFTRYFFRVMKGQKFVFSEHHDLICDALMDVHQGITTHLMINIPPRYSKTELCVKMFPAWAFVKNPKCEFIHLSYSDMLAMDNSDTVKQLLKTKEFATLWPDIAI